MAKTQKPLMVLPQTNISDLHAGPSTGLSFYIVETQDGFYAVLENADTLPLFSNAQYYCLDDLLNGDPVPSHRLPASPITITRTYPSRNRAIAALAATATISPAYTGIAGALPLIATKVLPVDTVFYRYVSATPDPRYHGGMLRAGTYLTSKLDTLHANTGFGAVGRFALPLPVPITHIIEYELLAGSRIQIGTVTPNFGQAGGGVEIHLPAATSATRVVTNPLDAY